MTKRAEIKNLEVWRELGAVTEDTGVRTLQQAKDIDIGLIDPSTQQPRRTFDQTSLEQLAESIRDQGLLQPIVVRPEGERFIIIAGHRRYRACQTVEMQSIPCIIREATEHEALEQSLIENVQREDIDPVEEAQCYRQLMGEHGYSIRDMAGRVHKSVGYIHGRLELLKHEDIAQSVARAEVGIFEARELAKVEDKVVRKDLIQKVAAGELDRPSLKREVKRVTGKARQPTLPALSRHWGELKRDLDSLEISKLAEEEKAETRRTLLEIKESVEALLDRLGGD